MSSPVNDPKLTPYVRGTTNAAVFFLQNGTARLVPDTATLTYMSAGQQVRTLSDADMAALPQGPPLPSRADGTLLIEAVSAATQAGLAFLMQGGLKRRIPDAQTAAGIENGGVQSHVIAPADAIAIPNGTPMPSRADGTVYQGTGGAFAFLLEKNLKSAMQAMTGRPLCRFQRTTWPQFRTVIRCLRPASFSVHPRRAFRCYCCRSAWRHASRAVSCGCVSIQTICTSTASNPC
jgi:hypothetical protein